MTSTNPPHMAVININKYITLFCLFSGIYFSCTSSNTDKILEQKDNKDKEVFYDTLYYDGTLISIYSDEKNEIKLLINQTEYSLQKLYRYFNIETYGIDLNYCSENIGNGFYLLYSITNDFSYLIDGNSSQPIKIYRDDIIAIDTNFTRVFFRDIISDSLKLYVDDVRHSNTKKIELNNFYSETFFSTGFNKIVFRPNGELYLQWRNVDVKTDTVIKF